MGYEVRGHIVAVVVEPFDFDDPFDATPGAAALHENDEVYGICDQPAGNSDDAFLDQLFQAGESRACGVGVDRSDAARMTGVPRFGYQSFRPLTLTDDDPVGAT